MTPSVGLALGLLLGGLFVLLLEMFIPSAGVLLLIAVGLILASVFVAFLVDLTLGLGFAVIVVLLALVLPWVGLNLWKRSWLARRMQLRVGPDDPEDGPATEDRFFQSLRGQIGRTVTPLRPSGSTEFLGRRVDTVSEGMMIDRDVHVRVVDVWGNRVVVRQLTKEEVDRIDAVLDFGDVDEIVKVSKAAPENQREIAQDE